MLERAGHHRPGEGVHVAHDERPAVLAPAADVRGAGRYDRMGLAGVSRRKVGLLSAHLAQERRPAAGPRPRVAALHLQAVEASLGGGGSPPAVGCGRLVVRGHGAVVGAMKGSDLIVILY